MTGHLFRRQTQTSPSLTIGSHETSANEGFGGFAGNSGVDDAKKQSRQP